MSWSISTTLKHEHTDRGIQKDLDALNELRSTVVGNEQAIKERDVQIGATIDAVLRCLSDGSTFDNAGEVSVSMSGHANPGNFAPEGMSKDYISISVYARSYKEN